jgi:hypothetical protein
VQDKLVEKLIDSLIEKLKIVTYDDVGLIAVDGRKYYFNSLSTEALQLDSISAYEKSKVLSMGKDLGQVLKLNLGHFGLSHCETLQREVYRECDSSDWLRRNQVIPVEDSKRNLIYFYSILSNRVVPFELKRFKKLMGLDDIKVAKVTIKCPLVHKADKSIGLDSRERNINCLDASPWVF